MFDSAHLWGVRWTLVGLLILAAAGCARRQSLPASHAQPERDPSAHDADPLSSHPVRVEVRRLHAACDETVVALQDGVEDAERRETILTAVAALAYVVGELADGDDPEGGMYGPGSTQAHTCTPGDDSAPGCNFQRLPSRGDGEGGPIDQQTDEVHLSASDQIRQINRGVDALDDFLFSAQPDPDDWSPAESARYDELRTALAAACDR